MYKGSSGLFCYVVCSRAADVLKNSSSFICRVKVSDKNIENHLPVVRCTIPRRLESSATPIRKLCVITPVTKTAELADHCLCMTLWLFQTNEFCISLNANRLQCFNLDSPVKVVMK